MIFRLHLLNEKTEMLYLCNSEVVELRTAVTLLEEQVLLEKKRTKAATKRGVLWTVGGLVTGFGAGMIISVVK